MKRNEGFTLIELVVATAILLVLTFMVGAMFRQATSAWDTGRVRGEGNMVARAIVGSVSRDLVCAVDPRPYGKSFPTGGSSLDLVCLKSPDADGNSVYHVVYNVGASSVTRDEEVWNGRSFTGKKTAVLYDKGVNEKPFSIDSPGETFPVIGSPADLRSPGESSFGSSDTHWDGPAAVKVRVAFTLKGVFSGVMVRSLGKNGVPDGTSGKNDDDIVIQ